MEIDSLDDYELSDYPDPSPEEVSFPETLTPTYAVSSSQCRCREFIVYGGTDICQYCRKKMKTLESYEYHLKEGSKYSSFKGKVPKHKGKKLVFERYSPGNTPRMFIMSFLTVYPLLLQSAEDSAAIASILSTDRHKSASSAAS